MTRNVARKAGALLAFITFSALSHAGSFTFTPGSWTNTTQTGAPSGCTITTKSDASTIAASLEITANPAGAYTVQSTWSFTATWVADSKDEVPPSSVQITLWRGGTPTVSGSGVARITSGGTDVVSVDSTDNFLSGIAQYLPDVVVTVPLVEQSDGSYQASGSLPSDTLSVAYDAQGGTQTDCVESFSLSLLQGVSQ